MSKLTWASVLDTIHDCVADDIENGNLTHDTDIYEYSHEFADGAEWVIYTHQSRSLWHEGSPDIEQAETDAWDTGIDRPTIDQLITLSVFCATRSAVEDEVRSQLDAKGMES